MGFALAQLNTQHLYFGIEDSPVIWNHTLPIVKSSLANFIHNCEHYTVFDTLKSTEQSQNLVWSYPTFYHTQYELLRYVTNSHLFFYYLKGEGIYLCMWYYNIDTTSVWKSAQTRHKKKKMFVLRILAFISFFLRSWDNCPHLLFCCLPEGGGGPQRTERWAMGICDSCMLLLLHYTPMHTSYD